MAKRGLPGYGCQHRTAGIRHPDQNRKKERTARKEQPEQGGQKRAAITGKLEWEIQKGKAEENRPNKNART
jgi:hypothetical protein